MVVERFQEEPAPATWVEFFERLESGRLITTGGKPLIYRSCVRCRRMVLGSADGHETCLCVIRCPYCRRGGPGTRGMQRCLRPSGHECADHAGRVALAGEDTERRVQAGDPDLPARWCTQRQESAEGGFGEQESLW